MAENPKGSRKERPQGSREINARPSAPLLATPGITVYGSTAASSRGALVRDDEEEGVAGGGVLVHSTGAFVRHDGTSSGASTPRRMLLKSQKSFEESSSWLAASFADDPNTGGSGSGSGGGTIPQLTRSTSGSGVATFYCLICCENVPLVDGYELSGGEGCRGGFGSGSRSGGGLGSLSSLGGGGLSGGGGGGGGGGRGGGGAGHKFCRECCTAWLTSRVGEGEISNPCPLQGSGGCAGWASAADVAALCDDATVAKFERFTKLRGDEGHLYRDCPKCQTMTKGHRFMSPQVHCTACGHNFCE
jgi:hypothetical protein